MKASPEPEAKAPSSKAEQAQESGPKPDTVNESAPAPPAQTAPPPKPRAPGEVKLERRQELEHHLKASPTDLDAFLELGRIYRAENRPIEAKRILQQAISVFPEEQELIFEYEEAVLARSFQQLREVMELAQRIDTVETDRELKRCQDDWACRRMEVCRARLARDPSQKGLRVALAEAMYDSGMHEGALEELAPILDDDDLTCAAHFVRGRTLIALGQELEAMASLRAASMRRSVVPPIKTRVLALRLLCETAERLGLTLTLGNYQQALRVAEEELAQMNHSRSAAS